MKKDAALLETLHSKFVSGAVKSGEDERLVEQFWADLMEFARYAFNASHAYSYGHLTYYTAWLKTHYPTEFYASLISNEEDPEKHKIYMEDARKNGINILPPDINISDIGFTAKYSDIVYGFSGIKGVGDSVYSHFTSLRPFTSVADFLIRTYLNVPRINKRIYDAIIRCGALDSFGFKRSVLIANYEKFLADFDSGSLKKEYAANKKIMSDELKERIREFNSKEDEYFSDDTIPEYNLLEILSMEEEILGVHISGNPFDLVLNSVKDRHYTAEEVIEAVENTGRFNGQMVIKINAIKEHTTKKGSKMAFISAVDYKGGEVNSTMFGDAYGKVKDILTVGGMYACYINSKHSYKGDGSIDFTINGIVDLTADMVKASEKMIKTKSIKEAILKHKGLPGAVRTKSIFNKFNSIIGECDISLATGSVYFDFELEGNTKVRVGPYYTEKIDVDMLRKFNSLPDIIVETR